MDSSDFIHESKQLEGFVRLFGDGTPIPHPSTFTSQLLSDHQIEIILNHLQSRQMELQRSQIVATNVVLIQRLCQSARECNYTPFLTWLTKLNVNTDPQNAVRYGKTLTIQDEGQRTPSIFDCPRDNIDVDAMIAADDKEALEFFGYWCCRIPRWGRIPSHIDNYFCPDFDWIDPDHSIELNRYNVAPEVVRRMCEKYKAGMWIYNTCVLQLVRMHSIAVDVCKLDIHQLFDLRCISHIDTLIESEEIFKYIEDGFIVVNPQPENLPSKYLFRRAEAKMFLEHPRAQPILDANPDLKRFLQGTSM